MPLFKYNPVPIYKILFKENIIDVGPPPKSN